MKYTPNLTRSELKNGLIAFALCMLVLPALVGLLMPDAGAAKLNFVIHFLNMAVIVYVLRRFLLRNLKVALVHPFHTIYYAGLGYLAHLALSELVMLVTYLLCPDFLNLNDQNVTAQLHQELGLMAIAVTVLAPIGEECFFRGLLLRGFYDRSPALAWGLSAGLFAAVHVVSYLGLYSPLELLLSFIQYLPAGVALALAYNRGGSIFCPILAHAIVNAMSLRGILS